MIDAYLIFLRSFLGYCCLIIITSAIGFGILKIAGIRYAKRSFAEIFLLTMTGTLAVVIIISMYITHGKTINILFLPLILTGYIAWKKSDKNKLIAEPEASNASFVPQLLLLALLPVLWYAFQFTRYLSGNSYEIDIHSLFYSEVSKCILNSGYENTFTVSNFASTEYNVNTPYHYFDLWLNGTVSKILHLDYSLCLHLIIYPFFTFIFLAGLLSVFELYVRIRISHIFLAFLFAFLGNTGIDKYFTQAGNYSGMVPAMVNPYGSQLLPVYCFFLLSLRLFLLQKTFLSSVFFLTIPIVSIVFLPSAVIGFLATGLFLLIRNNQHKYFILLLSFFCISSFCVLYFIIWKTNLNYRIGNSLSAYSDLSHFSWSDIKFYIAEILYKSWRIPLPFILNYIVFLLPVFFVFSDKIIRNSAFILITIILSGLVFALTFYKMEDSHEFFINPVSLIHVFLIICYIKFSRTETNKKLRIAISILFFSGLAWNILQMVIYPRSSDRRSFSQEYIQQINKATKNIEGLAMGGIFPDNTLDIDTTSSTNMEFTSLYVTYYNYPGIFNPNVFIPLNLIPPDVLNQTNITLKNPFSKFVGDQKQKGAIKALEQYQEEFITKNHLRYLIYNKENNPAVLEKFKVEKRIEDKLSGQVFVLLDRK